MKMTERSSKFFGQPDWAEKAYEMMMEGDGDTFVTGDCHSVTVIQLTANEVPDLGLCHDTVAVVLEEFSDGSIEVGELTESEREREIEHLTIFQNNFEDMAQELLA